MKVQAFLFTINLIIVGCRKYNQIYCKKKKGEIPMNDSKQALVCGKLQYYHPKRDHIYAVKQCNANLNTPTSVSLSGGSQSFAQKCTVEQNHNHYQQPQPHTAVQLQADHSFRSSELTSVVIHQESSHRIISDDNEDVIVVSPQNGTIAHLEAAKATKAKQRRLSESDILPQKKPRSIAYFLEATTFTRSEVCLNEQPASGPNNNENPPKESQMEVDRAETRSLA